MLQAQCLFSVLFCSFEKLHHTFSLGGGGSPGTFENTQRADTHLRNSCCSCCTSCQRKRLCSTDVFSRCRTNVPQSEGGNELQPSATSQGKSTNKAVHSGIISTG